MLLYCYPAYPAEALNKEAKLRSPNIKSVFDYIDCLPEQALAIVACANSLE
jgi:hypothetical protein